MAAMGESPITSPITWLVVNPASGSNDELAVAGIGEALAEAGYPAQRVIDVPETPLPGRSELEQAGVAVLVIFTGDGTANRAAAGLYGWDGAVLVLPGGTQNLLARSLHGEASAEEIVARLGRGELRRVRRSLLRCSAGDALVEIVAGPGAAWSDVRESLREFDLAEIAASMREAIEKSAGGPTVSVVVPPLGKAEGYPALRIYPSTDCRLAVDGYGADGILDYARHGLALLQRDFREGPHEELGAYPEVVCRSDAAIELMLDGERATGQSEERFSIAECDLTFLATEGTHG